MYVKHKLLFLDVKTHEMHIKYVYEFFVVNLKKKINLCILIIPNKHKFLTHDNDDSKITWCILRISMLSWLTLASQCIQMATTYNFQLGKTFHYTLCCLILNILVFTITITIMYNASIYYDGYLPFIVWYTICLHSVLPNVFDTTE